MLTAFLLGLAASATPASSLLVLDGWVIAAREGAKWGPPERSKVACTKGIQLTTVAGPSSGPTVRTVHCASEDESAPGALFVEPTGTLGAGRLEVTGPAPKKSSRKVSALPTSSKVYVAVVAEHLKRPVKGIYLHDVRRADLDGDGRDEVVIVAASRKPGEEAPARPDEWSLVLIRYLDGEAPKLAPLIAHDHTGEQVGPAVLSLRGVLDLDGDDKLELVLEDRDPWGIAAEIWRFSNGKVEKLTRVGVGE